MLSRSCIFSLLVAQLACTDVVAWMPATLLSSRARLSYRGKDAAFKFLASGDENSEESEKIERTSFDQAGASLIEEEDRKRMEMMGDFDSNDSYQEDATEKMRAAIRERTKGLGLEKSKVTADYIAQRERAALEAGPPGVARQNDPNAFGGLDLSQISQMKTKTKTSEWNEDMPSMFYDPEDDLSKEEQEEVDPMMLKNPIEQGISELSNAKWPDALSALREVALMFVVIAFSTLIIISWDTVLRNLYTSFGFIPTPEDVANYASRFDGLDLPDGWTSGMTDVDVQQYGDTISTNSAGGMPDL